MQYLLKSERRKGGRPPISEKIKDEVVEMYKSDFPIEMICQKLKISDGSVYNILKERTRDE